MPRELRDHRDLPGKRHKSTRDHLPNVSILDQRDHSRGHCSVSAAGSMARLNAGDRCQWRSSSRELDHPPCQRLRVDSLGNL